MSPLVRQRQARWDWKAAWQELIFNSVQFGWAWKWKLLLNDLKLLNRTRRLATGKDNALFTLPSSLYFSHPFLILSLSPSFSLSLCLSAPFFFLKSLSVLLKMLWWDLDLRYSSPQSHNQINMGGFCISAPYVVKTKGFTIHYNGSAEKIL